jgi:hypothetical protein
MSNRSSEIKLYASEDVTQNDKLVRLQTSNADFAASGAQAMKFDFASFQITDSAGGTYYNVNTRFGAIESDVSANLASGNAATAAVASGLAAELVARAAQDTVLGDQISAEISARASAVTAVANALDVQEAKQAAELVTSNAAMTSEISNRTAGDATEAAARTAADDALQLQITTLLGANTPAALQNLTAIVTAFQGQDVTHTSAIASLVTKIAAVEATLNELVNAGL